MAKSPAERKRDQRTRDKLSAQEKEALLLSRKIVTALYHNDDAALKRTMTRTGIDEEQDLISRFIRGADRMTDSQLAEFIRLLLLSRLQVTNDKYYRCIWLRRAAILQEPPKLLVCTSCLYGMSASLSHFWSAFNTS